MTAIPAPHDHTVTADDYAQLGEDDRQFWELQQGTLVRFPTPTLRHMIAVGELALRLRPQLPMNVEVVPAADVDLELAPPGAPGSCRKPDLVVVDRAALERVGRTGGLFRAIELTIVVEVVSAATRHIDHLVKRYEYAKAGIPRYWIIDLDGPVSLTYCRHADEFGYRDTGAVTGEFATSEPFDVRVDLNHLRSAAPPTGAQVPRVGQHT